MKREILERFETLVRARYPLIALVSPEEDRVLRAVQECARTLKKRLYTWSVTDGITCVEAGDSEDAAAKSPLRYGSVSGESSPRTLAGALDACASSDESALYVFKDAGPHLEDPTATRKLRDVVDGLRRSFKTVVMLGPTYAIPDSLEKDAVVIDVPFPDHDELRVLVSEFIDQIDRDERFTVERSADLEERVAHAVRGLTEDQVRRVLARVAVPDRHFGAKDLDAILDEKRQEIRKLGILEYFERPAGLEAVGGLDELKRWTRTRQKAFGHSAREYGLPEPKGVLLLGVQGCGKSLSAKSIAATLELPLLRLDVGRIFGSFVGQSEENMRKAISIAEGLAPLVLWIDEIEKGFGGTGSGSSNDSGATQRVFATFLTWMQEKTAPVFVVATANRIDALPPELLRKGRLDEIFFIDLPAPKERKDIFEIHLSTRSRDPKKFDLDALVQVTDGYSGAEIEQGIVDGMYDAFDVGEELSTAHVRHALERSVPLSKTMAEQIAALREWASVRARPATG